MSGGGSSCFEVPLWVERRRATNGLRARSELADAAVRRACRLPFGWDELCELRLAYQAVVGGEKAGAESLAQCDVEGID